MTERFSSALPLSDPEFNPFPGLRPFEGRNEQLFFGRDEHVAQLLDRLERQRFLAVIGTSASGKSSLVRAGLLPQLHGGALPNVGSQWLVATMLPGGNPIANLAAGLDAAGVLRAMGDDPPTRAGLARAVLSSGGLGLVELVGQSGLGPSTNLLVFVDQFEELFRFKQTLGESADQAALFVRLLLEASAHPASRIYVLMTMRSDFLGDCAQFRDLPERVNDSLFLVPRLTRAQMREAIEGPIGVAGATIAPQLVTRLLNGVGDDPDQLPVLQHALMRTWQRWRAANQLDAPISVTHYEETGQLAEALSKHGNEIYAGDLTSERQRLIAENVFKAVTDRGSDSRGVRRPTRFADLCAIVAASPGELRTVLDVFRAPGRSFLMPPPGVPLEGDTVIDITHESLMRVWTTLVAWVEEEADAARVYRRLADDAMRNRPPWRDADLAEARAWLRKNRERINEAWAARYVP